MTEFHIEIPPMARIGKWKSKFPRRQVIVAKKDDEMLNLICCNSIWSRYLVSPTFVKLFLFILFCGSKSQKASCLTCILNQVWSGLGSLTSKVHRYIRVYYDTHIFCLDNWAEDLYWVAPANTHTAAKWSVLPEQMQQMGRISRIFSTIQLVASFAHSLQYKSRFLSLVYNTIFFLHFFCATHISHLRDYL